MCFRRLRARCEFSLHRAFESPAGVVQVFSPANRIDVILNFIVVVFFKMDKDKSFLFEIRFPCLAFKRPFIDFIFLTAYFFATFPYSGFSPNQ